MTGVSAGRSKTLALRFTSRPFFPCLSQLNFPRRYPEDRAVPPTAQRAQVNTHSDTCTYIHI